MRHRIGSVLVALSLSLNACVAPKASKQGAIGTVTVTPTSGKASRPLVKIGTDAMIDARTEDLWQTLTEFGDWGAWNSHVTSVEEGFGLSQGAALNYAWDEKAVQAILLEVKENQILRFGPSAAGNKASLRWTLKSLGATRTLVTLQAEVPAGSPQSLVDKCVSETTAWITALNEVSLKRKAEAAASLKEAPPKNKKTKK